MYFGLLWAFVSYFLIFVTNAVSIEWSFSPICRNNVRASSRRAVKAALDGVNGCVASDAAVTPPNSLELVHRTFLPS